MAATLVSAVSAVQTVLSGLSPVAEEPVPPDRYVDPSLVGPGLIGFIMFVGLGVATFFLWRSMNTQLKRIDFDDEGGTRPVNAPFTEADQTPAPSAGAPNEGRPAG